MRLACLSASDARSSPGCLAVPHAGYAVVPGAAGLRRELRALHRHGRGLLVQARREDDAELIEQRLPAAQLQVQSGERGPLVPRDERTRVQAIGLVRVGAGRAAPAAQPVLP